MGGGGRGEKMSSPTWRSRREADKKYKRKIDGKNSLHFNIRQPSYLTLQNPET